MKESVAKTECIGLADVLVMAYRGWCSVQRISYSDVEDDLVDLGARIENYHRSQNKNKKAKKENSNE